MFLYLNRYSHIISINEKATYVRRNDYGIIVPCMIQDAYGVIDDSGDNFYNLKGKNDVENYTDIFSIEWVDDIPDGVMPRKYSYIDGEFVRNELYEETSENLTSASVENDSAICDIADLEDVNSTAIDDLAEIVDELINKVYELEEKVNG